MRTRPILGALLVLAMVTSGCVASSDVEVRRPTADAQRGGVIRIGSGQPSSIEPSNVYEPAGRLVVDLMCDALAEFDPVTGELKPAIAESWQLSDDGTRLTVRLRKGVKFHNGDVVTASDVVYSLSRIASADYASFVSSLLEPLDGYGELHGDVETDSDRDRGRLRGARVISGRSLELQLVRPLADFERLLGHPVMSPIPEEVAAGDSDAFAHRPVCAGPYALERPWAPDEPVIRLVRFADYYGANPAFTAGGSGYADGIEVHLFADRSAEFDAFLAGELDVTHVPLDRLGEARQLGEDLVSTATPHVEFVGGSLGRGSLWRNPDVRLALSQALDRRRLAEEVFQGGLLPATGFVSPAVGPTFRPNACGPSVPAEGDVASAQRRLSRLGGDRVTEPLRFTFNDEFANRRLVEAVARQWRDVLGVEIELVPLSWGEYLAQMQGSSEFDGFFRTSWEAPYPSVDGSLFHLFHSNGIGHSNFQRFSSLEFDRIIERARETDTEEDRELDYRRSEDLLCEQLPLIPLLYEASHVAVRTERVGSAIETLTDRSSGEPVVRELFLRAARGAEPAVSGRE